MNREELVSLTAPCGIDCFNCEVYEKNITEQMKSHLGELLGMEESKVSCKGCRASGGCRLHWNNCATLDCVIERGHIFCFECIDFPCGKLQPAADGASKYPHNLKLFNLCRIQKAGIEKWAEETKDIRRRYFQGKFFVGNGPQD